MKEKEIRERIERFLQRTARNVVVPASVGLSIGGCVQHPLHRGGADGGTDAVVQVGGQDSVDLPQVLPPYLVIMPRDALPDLNDDLPRNVLPYLVLLPDAMPDVPPADADADAESEAGRLLDAGADGRDTAREAGPDVTLPREVGPDIAQPLPPYVVPPVPAYLVLPEVVPAPLGGTAPMPLVLPKKND